jgi:hypothetical protein
MHIKKYNLFLIIFNYIFYENSQTKKQLSEQNKKHNDIVKVAGEANTREEFETAYKKLKAMIVAFGGHEE